MNVVFDLDGTLIDSRRRLYEVFKHLAPGSQLSYSQYWKLKRSKISNEEILVNNLGFDTGAISLFVKEWMELIEAPQFLALDENFPNMHEALSCLGEHAQLHICTARQHRGPVIEQLDRLNLRKFFRQVMVTEQLWPKELLIERHVTGLNRRDWLLGDTGKDVLVGKALRVNTCAVLSGFLDRVNLLEYEPDLVLNSAADFLPSYIQ